MKALKFILIVTVFLLINGCSSLSLFTSQYGNTRSVLAELSDYDINNGFITIETLGNGCTFYSDFKVVMVDRAENALGVVKIQDDQCRMSPRHVSLQYSFKHLGLDMSRKILVSNVITQNQTDELAAK